MNLKEKNDLSINLCRICLIKDGKITLDESIIDLSIFYVIKDVFNISIFKSKYCSTSICLDCLSKIKVAFELRNSICQAEDIWKKFDDNVQVSDIQIQAESDTALTVTKSTNQCQLRKVKIRNKRKGYKCKKCEKIVFSSTALKTHMTIHTGHKPFKCNVCEKLFSNSGNLYSHKKIHTEDKSYICEFCSKQFVSASYLKQHMRTHAPDTERQINCNKCDKIFRTKRFYLMHLKKHEGIRDIACSNCDKLFYHKRDLNRHIRTIHLEIKKFKCSICSRTFSNSGNLAAHKRIHTGEKPYECKYCDARFNQSTPLARHTNTHVEKGHSVKPQKIE